MKVEEYPLVMSISAGLTWFWGFNYAVRLVFSITTSVPKNFYLGEFLYSLFNIEIISKGIHQYDQMSPETKLSDNGTINTN